MNKLLNKIKHNNFFKNFLIVASGSVLVRIIGLATSPIISRLYSPKDYGMLSVISSLAAIIGSFATLRYSVVIPLPKKNNDAYDVMRLSFIITIALSILLSIITIIFGNYFASNFEKIEVQPFLWIIPLSFFGIGVNKTLVNWATREKKFKLITQTVITRSLSSRAVKILSGVLGIKPLGLLLGLIVDKFAGSIALIVELLKTKRSFFTRIDWDNIKYLAKRYKRFPLYQTWSQVFLSLGMHLPVMFMASLFGSETVGLFGFANGIINLPMDVIGNSLSQVYFAEISQYGTSRLNDIYKLSTSIVKKLFFVSVGPGLIIIIFGPWLFDFAFGAKWIIAGEYARVLTILTISRLIAKPISYCLIVLEKQKVQLLMNFVRVFIVFTVFMIAKIMKLESTITIALFSCVISGYYLLMTIYILMFLRIKGNIEVS